MGDQEKRGAGELPEISASTAARLLSVLLITADDELEDFRKRSIAKDSTVDPERLRIARQLLEVVGGTLLSTEEAHWQRLEQAHELLREPPQGPAPADDPGSDTDEPAADLAATAELADPARAAVPAPALADAAPVALPPAAAPPPPPAAAPPRPAPPRPAPVAPPAPAPVAAPPVTPAAKSPLARRVELPPVSAVQTETMGDSSEPAAPSPPRAPLPFKPDADKAPPPSVVDELPQMPASDVGETAALGAHSPLAGLALPFGKAAKEPAAGTGAEQAGPASATPDHDPSSQPVLEPTTRLQAIKESASDEAPESDVGETAAIGETSPLAGMELPFRKTQVSGSAGSAPSVPELTVEQYAAVHAANEAHPDRVGETRRQYGVSDEATWKALSAAWEQRLQADPALGQRFDQLLAEYRQWHQAQR